MAIYMWREVLVPADALCFSAKQANSWIYLQKNGSPTSVNIEISTDGSTWSNYTFGTTINLVSVWDKVYFRNKSATTTGFSTSTSNYYKFAMWWWINCNWNINYLLNKNWTVTTLPSDYCFALLFYNCVPLATPPELPATTLKTWCYRGMFRSCTNLTKAPKLLASAVTDSCYYQMFYDCSALVELPKLPAKTLQSTCYREMFSWCTKIKLSTTQTWTYQTAYRIPTTWTGTNYGNSTVYMFYNTWWTWQWEPAVNTTYYTSNQVI